MRFGWIVVGTLIGMAVYHRAALIEAFDALAIDREEDAKPEQKTERTEKKAEQPVEAVAEAPAFEKPLQTKHAVNPEEVREPVAALIDEAVHSPKVVEGPMKQAFEQAIHNG